MDQGDKLFDQKVTC